ncbi:MAG: alpha/beta hydrolase [bacterium JZ-2024 1]
MKNRWFIVSVIVFVVLAIVICLRGLVSQNRDIAFRGKPSQVVTPVSLPVVTTHGHFTDGELERTHTLYDYGVQGEIPGWSPRIRAPGDLVVIIQGFTRNEQEVLYRATIAEEGLRRNGFTGAVVAFVWDSDLPADDVNATWYRIVKRHAELNGTKLARFLTDYHTRNPHTRIHLVASSSGARVALETVGTLENNPLFKHDPWKITSVHLISAAVDNEVVQVNDRYGKAIETRVGLLFSYFSPADDILAEFYWVHEADYALGVSDIDVPRWKPDNYVSVDISNEWHRTIPANRPPLVKRLPDNYFGFWGSRDLQGKLIDDGVMNLVVPNMLRANRR